MGFWRSLAGTVTVQLTGADLAGSLRALSSRDIPVFQAESTGELTMTAQLYHHHLKKVVGILEKKGDTVQIIHHNGIYWYLRSALQRPVLLLGLAAVLTAVLLLPTRVLFIQVEGTEHLPPQLILERAAQCGIRFGASTRGVRSEKMKNALLHAMPELEWAGINTYGCVATISVRECPQPPQQDAVPGAGGIVAIRDGVVRSMDVTSGTPQVTVGQAVQEGELLISGYADRGLCLEATPAKGEIFGATRRDLTVFSPGFWAVREGNLATEKKFAIRIGKKRINFYKDSGILGSSCVKMVSEKDWVLPGGFSLPVTLIVEEWTQTASTRQAIPPGVMETRLDDFAAAYLSAQMIGGQVERANRWVEQAGEIWQLTGEYACVELLGKPVNWEIENTHGESDRSDR